MELIAGPPSREVGVKQDRASQVPGIQQAPYNTSCFPLGLCGPVFSSVTHTSPAQGGTHAQKRSESTKCSPRTAVPWHATLSTLPPSKGGEVFGALAPPAGGVPSDSLPA